MRTEVTSWTPIADREWLLDRGIAFEHAQTYNETMPMGSWARSQVGSVVKAHLVGLGSSMLDLAQRAIDWIDRAIARGEDLGPDRLAWHGLLTESKATAQWLLTGQNPAATWDVAFAERVATYRRHQGKPARNNDQRDYVDGAMACGYQAGRFADAIAFHDEVLGRPQVSAKILKTPRAFAYALSLRALGQARDSDEALIQAGHRVLQRHLVERWLNNGDYQRTAVWLKIVHELASPGLAPAQVLLKAYDDMPTVPRPDFLPG